MKTAPAAVGLFEGVRIAIDAIWSNKLRSFLTVLGNVIAVTSIILVVTIIQGVDSEVTELFAGEGADLFTVERSGIVFSQEQRRAMRNRPRLTGDDANFLRREGESFRVVMEAADGAARAEAGSESLDRVSVEGRSYEWALIDSTGLQAGRYFSRLEADRKRPVTILGSDIAADLFPGLSPGAIVGQRVRVRDLHLSVVGVMESRGSAFGVSRDEFAVVPIGMFQRMFGTRASLEFQIKPRHPDQIDEAMEEARVLMRLRHQLRPREDDDFAITSSDTFLGLYRQFTAGIYGALVGIVAMALVVGGIVIMNIMLMVVTERTREVGIRKAVGATYQQILWQFLVEAVTLSLTGGVVGILIGHGFAAGIASATPLPYVLEPWSMMIAMATVMLVGVVFGIYPASRAARLDPIQALSFE